MDIDYLSQLPIDMFIKNITYLPFDDVMSLCSSNTTLHNYCSNPSYNSNWKKLIDDTFGNIHNYQEKLKQIRSKLKINDGVYNYLVYSHLVKVLDPITQLIIYYKQKDMDSFNNPKFTNVQRFLSLFLLNKKDVINNYLPTDDYLPFISMLGGGDISQNILNRMIIEMAKEGSVKGVSMMLSEGADIHADNDFALRWASEKGHLEVVKYLTERGANVHAQNDAALLWASRYGHLELVKYLMEHGANVHAFDDWALRWASKEEHLEVVKYLTERGADIHADNDEALRDASKNGHLELVKYLTERGANIHADNDYALRWSSQRGHLEVVKYLVKNGADIHVWNNYALIMAREMDHVEVVEYLEHM